MVGFVRAFRWVDMGRVVMSSPLFISHTITLIQTTMERHNQFLRDFRLLLKKYLTEKAIAEAMAKVVDGSIETYYSIFLRYIIDPNRITVEFVEQFYKIFQADFDELRGTNLDPKGTPAIMKEDSKLKSVFEYINIQKENIFKYQQSLDQLLEHYHTLLLNHKTSTHLYYQLLCKYEEILKEFDDASDAPSD